MTRIIVCSGALALIIWGLRVAIDDAYKAWGFWPYMAICVGGTAVFISIGYAVDYASGRWPKSRRLKQLDHQPWEQP